MTNDETRKQFAEAINALAEVISELLKVSKEKATEYAEDFIRKNVSIERVIK